MRETCLLQFDVIIGVKIIHSNNTITSLQSSFAQCMPIKPATPVIKIFINSPAFLQLAQLLEDGIELGIHSRCAALLTLSAEVIVTLQSGIHNALLRKYVLHIRVCCSSRFCLQALAISLRNSRLAMQTRLHYPFHSQPEICMVTTNRETK